MADLYTFYIELKNSFVRTLSLKPNQIIAPENSHLFAAIGSALNYKEDVCIHVADLISKLKGKIKLEFEVERMEPLFENQKAYDKFSKRTASMAKVGTGDISSYTGNCYLGIDAGSTTHQNCSYR